MLVCANAERCCVLCGVCDVVAGYDARGRRVANVWCIARSVMCERVFAERVIYQRSSGGGRRAAGVH